MPLTDIKVKNAKAKDKPYKLADGEGMYLLITNTGGKYWRLKYRFAGKEKTLALGTYPTVSLSEAREKRFEAKKQIADGLDPSQEKQDQKLQNIINAENSFQNIAYEWFEKNKAKWKPRHASYIIRRLEQNLFNEIGNRPIDQIKASELLHAIQKIEKKGAFDIAKRALQTSGQIFRYAIATSRAERDISADLKGALTVKKITNHAKLEEKELPKFLKSLEKYSGEHQTKLAFKLIILTAVRTIELRGARWEEIDFAKKEWHIPAERMKMGEKHIVPLSKQSLAILKEMQKITGNREFVFPSHQNPNKFMSENTLLGVIYRLGYKSKTTTHGFRSVFSTILNEHGFNRDHIERQLAHGERDKVRATYNHAQYLKERHSMMQWWADYLGKIAR
ncbi:MAG: tyrosine-type recombinase/integrase [Rickettsiales bacterium]|nr:tyrosine-type recombinase/integrase [Rickettsiales bacterium]